MFPETFNFRVGDKRYRASVCQTAQGTITVDTIYGGNNACIYDTGPRGAGDRTQALVELAIAHYAIRRLAALAARFTDLADEA